jgi:hypothetical protein
MKFSVNASASDGRFPHRITPVIILAAMLTDAEYSICRALPADVAGIMMLAEENHADRGGALTGTLRREAVAQTIGMLPNVVARRNETVVGFVLAWEKTCFKHPVVEAMLEAYPGSPNAYVYGPVCVAVSERGKGLANAMFRKLCDLLPSREGILFINASNEPSLRAHRKMGMRMTGRFMHAGRTFLIFAYGG